MRRRQCCIRLLLVMDTVSRLSFLPPSLFFSRCPWAHTVYDILELNVQELRPPRMDDSGRTKYAVLFNQ